MDLVSLKWLLSGLALPPAGPLLLMLIGVTLQLRGRRRGGLGLVVAGLFAAWMSALSPVSGALMQWIERDEVALSGERLRAEMASAAPPGAIVVLAGGMAHNERELPDVERPNELSLARLAHGAWLARASGLPLLLSGGRPPLRDLAEARVMARTLERGFGLAPRWVEERSRDTADNASESAKLLRAAGIRRIVLVTHAYHMRRAAAAFEAAGLQVLRAPHGFAGDPRFEGPASLVPGAGAIRGSWLALHEALGLLWYRLRGHV